MIAPSKRGRCGILSHYEVPAVFAGDNLCDRALQKITRGWQIAKEFETAAVLRKHKDSDACLVRES